MRWFAHMGLGLVLAWRVRSDAMPHEFRQLGEGYWVDLISLRTGGVFWPNYACGPTESLAVIVAEQRYLIEQLGNTPVPPGKTYVDKAEERLRRGHECPTPAN